MTMFFCPAGHTWFSECTPTICPVCHKPASGAIDPYAYRLVLERVGLGVNRSLALHGDWRDYGLSRIGWVVAGELWEVIWAMLRGDIHGEHGVISELRDLAIVCVKAIERMEKRRVN